MHREWRRAEVSLRNLRNFILIFEVIRTQDVSGGAALDDLQFIDCAPCKFFFFPPCKSINSIVQPEKIDGKQYHHLIG